MSVVDIAPGQRALALFEPETALAVLTDLNRGSEFVRRVREEAAKLVPDVSTAKGRDEVRSAAFDVVKSKTFIEGQAKRLKEDAQKTVDAVNLSVRTLKTELDALAKEVRKPLTDWEEAEKSRKARCDAVMVDLQAATIIRADETSEGLELRLSVLMSMAISDKEFGDLTAGAQFAREQAVEAIRAGIDRARVAEAERAELEQLRAQAAERQQQEDARLEAEGAERELLAAEQAERERQRLAAERALEAEAQRLRDIEAAAERARQEAAEAARREQERLAEESRQEAARAAQAVEDERRRIQEAHEAEIAQLRRAAEEREAERVAAEQARQAEADRAARAAEQAAADQRRRNEDIAHKGRVLGEAKTAIMEHGEVDERAAKAIVRAIAAQLVPHVSVAF